MRAAGYTRKITSVTKIKPKGFGSIFSKVSKLRIHLLAAAAIISARLVLISDKCSLVNLEMCVHSHSYTASQHSTHNTTRTRILKFLMTAECHSYQVISLFLEIGNF